jgi:dTDP-glucose pyrophosphorylase
MSFGYFAGPQAITSSTTSHVPSSSAQFLTVVVHQQERPTGFAEAVSHGNDFILIHSTVLFAFGAMNIYGVYIR